MQTNAISTALKNHTPGFKGAPDTIAKAAVKVAATAAKPAAPMPVFIVGSNPPPFKPALMLIGGYVFATGAALAGLTWMGIQTGFKALTHLF